MAELSITPPSKLVIDLTCTNMKTFWEDWSETLEMYFLAANINETKRKKALMLYLAGEELRKIYKTLNDDKDTYEDAKQVLDNYFKPKSNLSFERYKFRSTFQENEEGIASFVTRLKNLASTCDFDKYSTNDAIVDQVIEKCTSQPLRHRFLRESELTLEKAISIASAAESADSHASEIEKSEGKLNHLRTKSTEDHANCTYQQHRSERVKLCYGCGESGHLHGSPKCPALGTTCSHCKNQNHFSSACMKRKEKSRQHVPSPSKETAKYIYQEDSDDEYVFAVSDQNMDDIILKLDNAAVPFLIDSGATINIIDSNTYDKLCQQNTIKFENTLTKVYAYGSKQPMKLKGEFHSNVSVGTTHDIAKFLVADTPDSGCILSRSTATKLGLLNIKNEVKALSTTTQTSSIQSILDKHKHVFTGVGKLKDFQLKLNINDQVKPVTQHLRRIPFHVRKKVDVQINELLENEIIEQVEGPTTWVSPLVAVPKGEDVRLVVDMRQANEAIKRSHYPIPTLEELLENFNGCTRFSKIDLKHGYHQIELEPDSRNITTFSTHSGLYRFTRLVQGANSAFEEYQHIIGQLLQDCPRTKNISDDILIGGKDQADHDENLAKCLHILSEHGLTANIDKCVFNVTEIEFFGFVISKDGIRPTESKIAAIQAFDQPQNPKEVSSFLALVNYLGRFIPNLASQTEALRKLTHKGNKWTWGKLEQETFLKLKTLVSSDTVMVHFDTNLETYLIVDAGPIGLGAILAQKQHDGSIRSVSYASRTLTPVERRYSQTERETLGVVWGCERFHLYLYGSQFTILTDHKPLEIIYSPKGKPFPRILRWGLRLQSYTFEIQHIPGNTNPADILSIKPIKHNADNEISCRQTEHFLNSVIAYSVPKAVTLSEILASSRDDPLLVKVEKRIKSNTWRKKETYLKPYYNIRHELTYKNGIILRDTRIVIPKQLRPRILKLAHETHQGITKTKALLREKVWWPNIDRDIEEEVKACIPCLSVSPPNNPEPLQPTKMSSKPWQTVHIDICRPFPTGESILGIIDSCSRWPEIHIIRSTTSSVITDHLQNTFTCHGYPEEIVTDNAPNLTSVDVTDYCSTNGISHRKVIPYWPQGNAMIERFYRTLGKAIKAYHAEGKNWKKHIHQFLLTYRNTPHSSTNASPAKLLLGRSIRDKIPQMPEQPKQSILDAQKQDTKNKEKMKQYHDKHYHAKVSNVAIGDLVLLRQNKTNKLSSTFDPQPYKVVTRKGSAIIISRKGKIIMRNVSLVRKIHHPRNYISSSGFDELEDTSAKPDDEIQHHIQEPLSQEDYMFQYKALFVKEIFQHAIKITKWINCLTPDLSDWIYWFVIWKCFFNFKLEIHWLICNSLFI